MKKILITGVGSYIGTSFENYINTNFPELYTVDALDMTNDSWRDFNFSGYDSVYHVAGIAHSDTERHMSEEKRALYQRVNTDLSIEVAQRAKADGVRQFVFMSSAIVYGNSAPIGKSKVITKETLPTPKNVYAMSKLLAEQGLSPLADNEFKVCIVRSPMVYGKGSRGNYLLMSKLARKLPIFPKVNNCRSMIYVENLVEFVRLMIENCESGVFLPQNKEYTVTTEMIAMIAGVNGKRTRLVRGFTWMLKLLSLFTGKVNKAFGSLCYDQSASEYKQEYRKYTLAESIKITES